MAKDKKSILKRVIGGVNKVADKVTDFVGGRDLAEYAGSKIAGVKSSVSGGAALKSAANVALNVGALAGVGKLAGGIGKAGKSTFDSKAWKSDKASQMMGKSLEKGWNFPGMSKRNMANKTPEMIQAHKKLLESAIKKYKKPLIK